MNVPRLYRAAITLFGLSFALNALDAIRVDGFTVLDAGVALVGSGIAALTLVARDPERHGYPTERNLQFYLVVVGSILVAASVFAPMISVL
ncbi:hypothetical protein SAMN04487950_2790 [Halogranum rubrum]|uniref:Uncharacterized protein n=1 Tax=Halogranum rubrum TaxID=553466 RepID=A0A1I4FG49_9EURY|nr:hypothetical protein [Halogranum rubrum]SFL15907.1 hypothetical protein SAMN04487950_2790 [Halogranum rubrum]